MQSIPAVVAVSFLAASLAAQAADIADAAPREAELGRAGSPPAPRDTGRFRIDLAVGGGKFGHHTDGVATLDDDTDGSYVRIGLEYVGEQGFGGGLRLEGSVSDDDLFLDTSATA